MEYNDLQIIFERFGYYVTNVDFRHLPERDSEEYRRLLLQTANDAIFCKGIYTENTEMTLELFEIPELVEQMHDLNVINALSPAKRHRLGFYRDLVTVCYPLFRHQVVDWTSWPWLMQSASSSLDNSELFDLITSGTYPCLAAAILYDLKCLCFDNMTSYSCVARQEAANAFGYTVNRLWEAMTPEADEARRNELVAAEDECANQMWLIENHLLVGRQLGFDLLTQSVYDAMDTFIDSTYRHNQVSFAREMAEWIRQHWPMGEEHPERELLEALYATLRQLMTKHGVSSPDLSYTWNILTLDVLGVAICDNEEDTDEPID